MKKIMKVFKYTVAFLVFIGIFFSLQRLLMPKYMSDVYDGALIGEYYAEPKNHSVIMVGDCEVYQNFSPAELFREHGITSYIRGGASQTVWQSYWLLEDTLKHEIPQAVIFSILPMNKSEAVSEPYNRLNIEGMKLSAAKLGAVNSSMVEGEEPISYILPIFRYHERWREISSEDFRYFWKSDKVGLNGYLMRSETVPVTFFPRGQRLDDYEFADICWEYLDKTRELCKAYGIELILLKSPAIWPYWYDQWEEQIVTYADEHSLTYYNLLKMCDETGIDYSTDTANAGQHLNFHGAEKLSRWLGAELKKSFDFPDYRNDPQVAATWERKIHDYEQLKAIQLKEYEENKKVSTITYTKS